MTVSRRVVGIDFSGGSSAGRKIWLAEGTLRGERVDIDSLRRACDLPGSEPGRDRAIAALREWIAAQPGGTLIGCDFPFSLARAMHGHATWDAFTAAFAHDYPQPEALYEAGRAAGSPVRRADRDARTPFAPHNLRIYRQTYYGIRDVLAPLAAAGQARILPFHDPAADLPALIEVCPASRLKAHGRYQPYKGAGLASARARLVDWLTEQDIMLSPALRAAAVDDPEGDALDSLIAAVCAAHALAQIAAPVDALSRIEGRVYY